MKKHIIDEKNGLAYTLVGDYYYPDIALEAEKELAEIERKISSLGKYAKQRRIYLKNYQNDLYIEMLGNDSLYDHLKDIDDSANLILKQVTEAFAKADGCDENLKATDQMKWVGLMNNYRHCAEEIINSELIYA